MRKLHLLRYHVQVLGETATESADKRRRLCEGDATTALLRASQEAKLEEIAAEKTRELRAFFCDDCCKQYASVTEWEVCLTEPRLNCDIILRLIAFCVV